MCQHWTGLSLVVNVWVQCCYGQTLNSPLEIWLWHRKWPIGPTSSLLTQQLGILWNTAPTFPVYPMIGYTGYFDTWPGSCGLERIEGLVWVWEGEYMDWLYWDRKDTWLFILGGGCYMYWLCKKWLVMSTATAAKPHAKSTHRPSPSSTLAHIQGLLPV